MLASELELCDSELSLSLMMRCGGCYCACRRFELRLLLDDVFEPVASVFCYDASTVSYFTFGLTLFVYLITSEVVWSICFLALASCRVITF